MTNPRRPTEKPRRQPKVGDPEEFSRFEDLAKRLIVVPKEEVDEQRAAEAAKKKKLASWQFVPCQATPSRA